MIRWEVELLLCHSTVSIDLVGYAGRGVQLERPQEVGGVLEVGANRQDLMDQVLHADDAELAQGALNEVVGGDWGAVAVDLDEPTLIDQLANRLEVGHSTGLSMQQTCLSPCASTLRR